MIPMANPTITTTGMTIQKSQSSSWTIEAATNAPMPMNAECPSASMPLKPTTKLTASTATISTSARFILPISNGCRTSGTSIASARA